MDTGDTAHRITPAAAGEARQWWRSALSDKPVERIALVLVALGCVLRALHFLGGRSLWLDEAMVADSIVHRDWAGLLLPLTYDQVAPLGWLMVERASFLVLGGSDLSLRAPALLAGIASLLLFARVARRSFESYAFILAIAAFAISYVLVFYSAEVKPYGLDTLVSVVALTFATNYLQQDRPLQARDYLLLLLVGLASVFVSFPAAFVFAGLGGALFLRDMLKRRWAHALCVVFVSSAWLFAFSWIVLQVRQGASVNVAEMTSDWNQAYAPLLPTNLGELIWYPKAIIDALQFMFKESMVAWLLAIAVGAALTIRSRLYLGVALLIPLAAALVASGLRLYPFNERLLLFALPEFLFLAFIGVQAAVSAFKAPLVGSLIAAVLLLYGPAQGLWDEFAYRPAPFATDEALPVMRAMSAQTDVDAIYVSFYGLPAFRYYQQRAGLAGVPVIAGREFRNSFGCLFDDIVLVSRHRRIWVYYWRADRGRDIPDQFLFMYFADATGRRLRSVDLSGVKAYLYEFDEAGAQRLSAIRNALSLAGACNVAERSAPE